MKKGFTLLELIIVVIIIGILAAIVFPRFVKTTATARAAEALAQLGAYRSAMERYYAGHATLGYGSATLATLDVEPGTNPKFIYTMVAPTASAYTIISTYNGGGGISGSISINQAGNIVGNVDFIGVSN